LGRGRRFLSGGGFFPKPLVSKQMKGLRMEGSSLKLNLLKQRVRGGVIEANFPSLKLRGNSKDGLKSLFKKQRGVREAPKSVIPR